MEQATLSLYLDLEPGRKADLEVVARASLAWAAAIREMAASVDPMSEVRIELVDGTEGSLSLNALIRLVRSAVPSKTAAKAVILSVLLWMSEKAIEWSYEQVLDAVREYVAHRSEHKGEAEQQQIARDVHAALNSGSAEPPRRQMFRELERDEAITGVGASEKPGERPAVVVPRADFARRASDTSAQQDADDTKRIVTTELHVVLVSPVLKDAERRWRFQHGALPEFGATMKDHDFLQALRAGRIEVQLKPGVEMRIELQSKEELVGGVWQVRERSVTRVIAPSDRSQSTFLLPTEK